MNGFFSFFGKFVLVVLVIGLLIGGGYYLGKGKLPFMSYQAPGAVTTVAVTPDTPTPTTTDERPITGAIAPTASPTAATTQTVTGGGLPGLSFGAYTLQVPVSWTVKKETNAGVSEKISITQGAYTLAIYQAPTGGAQCTYPGETPVEMSTAFGAYTTIHDGSGGEFRRALAQGSTSGFTVCQKGSSGFGLPTMYGHVTYGTPAAPDPAMLLQMDAIFATLKKS